MASNGDTASNKMSIEQKLEEAKRYYLQDIDELDSDKL